VCTWRDLLTVCFKAAKKEKPEKKTRMDKYEEEKDSGVRAAHELFMKHKCCWCVHKAAVLIRSVTYPFTVWCGVCAVAWVSVCVCMFAFESLSFWFFVRIAKNGTCHVLQYSTIYKSDSFY
jgi:hypothetical protein